MINGHKPIIIDQFNGLWDRGDGADSVPKDHFSDCSNLRYIGTGAVGTRFGVSISQDVTVPLSNVKRIYNYPQPTGNTLIVMTSNDDNTIGYIYHVVDSDTVYGPILTKTGMRDFAFVPYAGRGYISPIGYYTSGDLNVELGLQSEFLYVYLGAGAAARKAAGSPLSGSLTIVNGAAGHTDPGFHLFAFVAETDSGFLTAPGAITGFTTAANFSVSFTTVPTSGSATVVRRHLVATKVITGYSGNTTGYQFFFVPNATIENNTDTFLSNISFFDIDLLEDASYLIDNYSEIPAGAVLNFYHNRLCLSATYDDISICLVSAEGEPEAIDQVSGLIIFPLDGNPITNGAELRDVLYLFKRTKCTGWVDNGDDPSTWPATAIDNALGASIHGIGTVLDSGSASVDKLIVANYAGVFLFNGLFVVPELSWKIQNFWANQDEDEFRRIQVLNDQINQQILLIIPDQRLLSGNYLNGMTPKNIRWCPISLPRDVNTVAIVNVSEIIIGLDLI